MKPSGMRLPATDCCPTHATICEMLMKEPLEPHLVRVGVRGGARGRVRIRSRVRIRGRGRVRVRGRVRGRVTVRGRGRVRVRIRVRAPGEPHVAMVSGALRKCSSRLHTSPASPRMFESSPLMRDSRV